MRHLNRTDHHDIFICASYFECEWITARGGRRPAGPPTLFPGEPRSCLKQRKLIPITTKLTSNTARQEKQKHREKIAEQHF